MANINDFKSRLAGGGARANQFRVILPPPVGQVTAAINTEQFAFLCRSASLPGQTLAEIAKKHKVNEVVIESNFGDGLFMKMLNAPLQ